MPCGWEGNRRSGVALAMRHRLQWFIHLQTHGLDREMSTPPTLLTGHDTLCLYASLTDRNVSTTSQFRVEQETVKPSLSA